MRRIADAEVRLFHLYVHEPMIRDGVPELEMAEEMGELAGDILPLAAPLTEYLHTRYLRFFLEQDVVGHMESGLGAARRPSSARSPVTLCFIDLTGFTRYTEEEGDLEALDVVENFVETVEATLPPEATIVKTIGDEVMVVSPDAASLTEWAVGFLSRFPSAPSPASASTAPRPSTATATTSAPTSTSPTAWSAAPRPARCWSPTGWPRRSRAGTGSSSSRSARSA